MFPWCPYPLSLIKASGFHPAWRPRPLPLVPAAPTPPATLVSAALCVAPLAVPSPAATGSAGQRASGV